MKKDRYIFSSKQESKQGRFFAFGLITGIIFTIIVTFLLRDQIRQINAELAMKRKTTIAEEVKPDSTAILSDNPLLPPENNTTAPLGKIAVPSPEVTETDTLLETVNLEDTEFSILPPESDDVVVSDKVISERKIKVINKSIPDSTGVVSHLTIAQFDVQQWSTPIKNSISYHKNNHQLRIRGLDISDIEIIFFNNEYYLIKGSVSYILKDNAHYERLVIKAIPNPQDL